MSGTVKQDSLIKIIIVYFITFLIFGASYPKDGVTMLQQIKHILLHVLTHHEA